MRRMIRQQARAAENKIQIVSACPQRRCDTLIALPFPIPMFSFFKRKPKAAPQPEQMPASVTEPEPLSPSPSPPSETVASLVAPAPATMPVVSEPEAEEAESNAEIVPAVVSPEAKQSWFSRLKSGLSKTSSSLTTLFVGAKIDEALYEELESALLMAAAGVEAPHTLLEDLKKRVKEKKLP